MAAAQRAATRRNGGAAESRPALPPVTVAKMRAATELIERLATEKTSVFIDHQQAYRERHRSASSRPLSADEAAAVAAGLAGQMQGDPVTLAERVQRSELRAYDEPEPQEVLLAAGLATAPAFLDVALELVALVEMPAGDFEEACEAGLLDDRLRLLAEELAVLELSEARGRAQACLEHVGRASGQAPGEALGLIGRVVGQAWLEAQKTILKINETRRGSSLTGSLEPTDGDAGTSSTAPPTGKP